MSRGLVDFCETARAHIASAQKVLLASHVLPDADSIGSQAALARHLDRLGKSVCVCNPTPVQEYYGFLKDLSGLPREAWFEGPCDVPPHDLIIVLDVNDWDYMGPLGEILRDSPVPKLLFDHHHGVTRTTDVALVDPLASATGEVLYRYFLATGAEIDTQMAAALYASILFDTGGFRFRNTRDETVLIAAELIRRGASHTRTAARLFENESFSRVELLTAALSRVVSDATGRLVWTYVTQDMFTQTGTSAADADGVIDQLMTIRGVELGVLFRELSAGGVKVTFRSKGRHDVGALAERLGGGGRPTASGVGLDVEMEEAITTVLEQVQAVFGWDGERRSRERNGDLRTRADECADDPDAD